MKSKTLNKKQVGLKQLEKLKSLSVTGELATATTRAEVAMLVGYTTENKAAGYNWVSLMIKKGILKEESLGYSPDYRKIYSYSIYPDDPINNYVARKQDIHQIQIIMDGKNTVKVEAPSNECFEIATRLLKTLFES